jgi:hypothetical protein
MSAHEYLSNLLAGQSLGEQELALLRNNRAAIEQWLRGGIGAAPRFYYAGSYAKNTMLRHSYDLDIVVYFPANEPGNLQQIFNRVHQRLLAGNLVVQPRTVALRLPYQNGFHIDVVPGRAQDHSFRYATLFKNTYPPSILQTSLKVHIEAVKDAGLSDVVRAAKLWRHCHRLDIPTFALEIAVSNAMNGVRRDNLGTAFWAVLEYLSRDFSGARLVDPANSNNVIDVSAGVRSAVALAAQQSKAQKNWGTIVW